MASDGPVDWYGGLFSDLDRRLIVAVQDGSHKIDSAVLNKPHGGWVVLVVGCALVSGLVRSMSVVMPRVLGQDPGCVALVVDQDAVGALGTDGADEPLGITVRMWSAWRCLDDRDVLAAEHGVEARGERGVPVPDEEAERGDPVAQLHGQVTGGLGDPLPGWVRGHSQNVDLAGPYFDHVQDIQAA
jgi:hypothetical protein